MCFCCDFDMSLKLFWDLFCKYLANVFKRFRNDLNWCWGDFNLILMWFWSLMSKYLASVFKWFWSFFGRFIIYYQFLKICIFFLNWNLWACFGSIFITISETVKKLADLRTFFKSSSFDCYWCFVFNFRYEDKKLSKIALLAQLSGPTMEKLKMGDFQ